ncbi:hypothetical protein KFE94_04580 [bacterium SCSIO 12643]|nr:hypothetical protein KFE94_04580 [bacterium SCSIO 12643]
MSNSENTLEFKGVTYINHELHDTELFDLLPSDLKSFYKEINGLVAYNGGFQIRGCGTGPSWNSLEDVWKGKDALHHTYKNLQPTDIPFAQDCLGDQYIYRSGSIWQLLTETGDLDDLELDFDEFIDEVIEDPVEFLALYPLIEFIESGNELQPGELLVPNIPFSVETEEEYTFTKARVNDRLKSLKEFYSKNK